MKKNLLELMVVIFLLIISTIGLSAQENIGQQKQPNADALKASLAKAQSLAKQGKKEEASKIYTDLMQSYPDNKEDVQGWLILNMKRTPTGEVEAIKQLEDLQNLYPKNTGILFFKFYIEAEHGQNEEALKDCDKLIKLQPDTALNYVGKGQVLVAMKKFKEACKAFEKATKLNPNRFDVWVMKAGAEERAGKFNDAISSMNKAVELKPQYAANYYNRACFYCLKGDTANAMADLKKAIDLNPSFKQSARKDEDFKSLYDNVDFKKLVE
jgi:tetratricopeptide (TPR) repeat protein